MNVKTLTAFGALAWLTGCNGGDKGDGTDGTDGTDGSSATEDSDGDGIVDAADCAPMDASRYPGATDIPDDGLDQDCNGSDTVTCFLDRDGDGVGGSSTGLSQNGLCDAEGFAESSDDCDDDDLLSYPGADEVCDDGADNDCDATLDCDDEDCVGDSACPLLYAADGKTGEPGNLYQLDPVTGVATTIGPVGYAITGLAFSTDGRLFGSEATQSGNRGTARLIEVDLETGAGTPIGELFDGTLYHNSTADITFVGSRLIGWSELGDDPIEIDVDTGAVTVIGNSGVATAGSGLAADPDGAVWFAPGRVSGSLYQLDVSTGTATEVTTLSGGTYDNINSMTFLRGTLYAVETNDEGSTASLTQLVTLDTTTGLISPVTALPTGIDSLAGWPL